MKSLPATLVCFAALALGACHSVPAQPRVALGLRDADAGTSLPIHSYGGDRYVAGAAGQRYTLDLRNLTGRRQLVVVSVDGINAVSGETAATSQSGYVLEPYQHTEIRGWRKSLDSVAQFHFAALPDSYAARTGRPDNVGVIGIAVFEELPTPPPPVPRIGINETAPAAAQRSEAGVASADQASPEQVRPQVLGTGHGEQRYDPALRTQFQRASATPAEVQRLFYDSRENLVAAGVLPRDWPQQRTRPDPFPASFVPDPD